MAKGHSDNSVTSATPSGVLGWVIGEAKRVQAMRDARRFKVTSEQQQAKREQRRAKLNEEKDAKEAEDQQARDLAQSMWQEKEAEKKLGQEVEERGRRLERESGWG